MTIRQNGFYWVRYRCPDERYGGLYDEPIIAEWHGQLWELPGNDVPCRDENVIVLSDRLEPPLAA
jgi:hypothetical protein